ncbi:MAG TPA: ABC transporter substrate-binding protein [Stellaceae bacterium]|nr:ABC transporter substrate-binding protein [Stellaceae bacterium]
MTFTRVAARLFVGFAAAAIVFAAPSEAATTLTVGYGTAGDFLPLLVAKDKGFLAQHGLDAKLIPIPNGSMSPSAVESGSVQIAYTTPSILVLAVAGGLDQVAVAGAARLLASNPRTALVTRPGVTVTKPQDLIGKRVGVPGLNQALDLNIKKWMLDHGIGLDRYTLVEAPLPQLPDMLKAGQIDAAPLVEPVLGRALAQGDGTKSVDITSINNPDELGSLWEAGGAWANANKPAVAAFRAALDQAIASIVAHPDDAKTIEKKYLKFAEPTLPNFATKIAPADFQYWIDILTRLKLLPQPVDAAKIVFD